MYDLFEVWLECTNKLKESIHESIYNVWIEPIMPLELTDTYLKVAVNSSVFGKMLENKYASKIEATLEEILGKKIHLIIESLENKENTNISTPEKKEITPITVKKQEQLQVKDANISHLNPKYIFENFIVGNANRMAFAAASNVADNPGNSYNPLFIYGGSGLGKTHLMHAIGNRIISNNQNMKVLYLSCETFTNEIIQSIQHKTTDAFRQKYRNIDCLIIDDIQFLRGKEQTQVEFFHTFNALHDANKQIIISSDRPPKEIETLEDRLRTRFEWGLQADIQPPDLETRIAIIRQKASNDNIELPNDVVTLLATNITTNIREIEGAYTKLVAYTSLMDMPITIETAQKVLNDMKITTVTYVITADTITKAVAEYFNIKTDELFKQKRTQNIAYPRQIAMYLCRELADLSYPKIGELFGKRDHTTVLYAYDKIYKGMQTDLKIKEDVTRITEIIKQ
ncbi:MAG: chromosomal replication initiator protein DnaA [Phascolarctobacterium sp.]|nr:chromosomal replication initiator protein DnaA [Phascolarctobacterium sp.]